MQLIVRPLYDVPGFDLVPAPANRAWMDATTQRFAYRCLPLSIANQAGWVITCPLDLTATWTADGVQFQADDPAEGALYAPYIGERFAPGIVAFAIPYAFRTDPGFGLLIRGASNDGLVGAHPLDSFVDTGAAEATFTLDWQLLVRDVPVRFARGMVLGMLQPYPTDLLESVVPRIRAMEATPEVQEPFEKWAASRGDFLASQTRTDEDWQKDYFQGKTMTGERVGAHRTRLHLKGLD